MKNSNFRWLKDKTWQWIIGTIAMPFILFGLSKCGDNKPTGNGNLLISCSPGATINSNQPINPDSLAAKIAKQLPGYQNDKNKEELIKTLSKQVAQLQKDKNPFREKALNALSNNRLDEYMELLEKAAEYEKNAYRKKAAQDQINIGTVAQFINPQKAQIAFTKAIELWPDWNTCLSGADFYQFLNEFQKSEQLYLRALAIVSTKDERATTLNNLGNLQAAKNNYPEAEKSYQEALKTYRELARTNPQTYLPNVATTLNNLGALQADKNNYPEAEKSYQEALKIRRELARANPQTYLPDVATTLNNLGNLQAHKNNYPEAKKSYQEALKTYRELARTNPQTYLPNVATTLNNLGVLQADKNNYPEAEKSYQEALKIRRELARTNPQTYLPNVAMTLNNLGVLQAHKNNYPEAEKSYQEALKTYRELARTNPQTYLPNVATTLINQGIFFLQSVPDQKKSLVCIEEALRIVIPLTEKLPYTKKYVATALGVVKAWNIDEKEFLKKCTQQQKRKID